MKTAAQALMELLPDAEKRWQLARDRSKQLAADLVDAETEADQWARLAQNLRVSLALLSHTGLLSPVDQVAAEEVVRDSPF